MPPRLMTGAIIAFWLTMTGFLIHREVLPMMLADSSPTYQMNLMEEIGSPVVGWTIYQNDKRIGSATSKVHANKDGTFEFRSNFHFDRFTIAGTAQINHLESMYRVTKEGRLQALFAEVGFGTKDPIFGKMTLKGGIRGEVVENNLFDATVFFEKIEHRLDKIDISQQGSIINPMQLVNRLRGLREGQSWRITLIDPLQGVTKNFVPDQSTTVPALITNVKSEKLDWDRKEVACYVIEYFEPGKDPVARTWVRRSDGLVLQQEARHLGSKMILRRNPD